MMTSIGNVHGQAELTFGIYQVIVLSAVIIFYLYTSISITMTQEELRLGMTTHVYNLYILATLSQITT
jgi:hypothetical protein